MNDAIAAALGRVRASGSYCARLYADPDDLSLEVRGVGPLQLPVSATQARQLIEVARPAPFGWREETKIDKTVRDTWEVAKSRVRIDARRWKKTLDPLLDQVAEELGLPTAGKLRAELHKLLVYEPGQFFAPHQDSEKAGDMVGTLVVGLPSRYSGGAMVLTHLDQRTEYRFTNRSSRELTCVAFYSDCRHEVRPVKQGYRVALAYNLYYTPDPGAVPASGLSPLDARRLKQLVAGHFASALGTGAREDGEDPPRRLVFLLDHGYSEHSLGWRSLKRGDAARAAALRAAASELDCEVFLAQADLHESWLAFPARGGHESRWGRRSGRGPGWGEDDEPEADSEDYEFQELIDSSIGLDNWIDERGEPFAGARGSVWDSELSYLKENDELRPFQCEYLGYQGNYGNTLDRWYRRAAVVVWPRALAFGLRAEAAPEWAVDHLRELRKNDPTRAELLASQLRDAWRPRGDSAGLCRKTVDLVSHFGDGDLAAALIDPFDLAHLGPGSAAAMTRLWRRHGSSWWRARIESWLDRGWQTPSRVAAWAPTLNELCGKLAAKGSGRELGLELVSEVWSRFQPSLGERLSSARRAGRPVELDLAPVASLLAACDHLNGAEPRREILTQLAEYPLLALDLADALAAADVDLEGPGIMALREQVRAELEAELAQPPRGLDDWSIRAEGRCTCRLCTSLAEFLEAPDRVVLEWPLAKEKRRHVHREVEARRLPVSHATRRQGRPYTLVLEKTRALFQRDRERRRQIKAQLGWL